MRAKLLMLFSLILLMASVSAVASPAVTVSSLNCTYTRACAEFTWGAGTAPDFNNFRVSVSSTDSTVSVSDYNTVGTTLSICGFNPDYSVTGIIVKYDGNSEGLFTNMTAATCTVTPGGTAGGGKYLIYNVFVALGTIAGLIILVVVIVMVMAKLNIVRIGGMFGKK